MKDIFNQNKKIEQGLEFLLFVVAFSIPFSSAFNSISIGALFLYSFIWFSKNNFIQVGKNRRFIYLFILFFSIQVIGILYSDNLSIGIKVVSQNASFLLFPIIFINLSNRIDKKKIQLTFYGLLTGILLILLSAHFTILTKIISKNGEFKGLFFSYIRESFIENAMVPIHSPYFGLLTVFVLICSYRLNFFENKQTNRFLKGALMLYLSFSIYEISALMSMLLFLLFSIIQFILLAETKRMKGYLLLTFIVVALFSMTVSLEDITKERRGRETIINRVTTIMNKGDGARKENWKSVISVIKNNLVFGVGSDGGLKLLQQYRDIKSEPFINKHNAHNQYLEVFLRYGIIGLSIFLILIFRLTKQAFISKNYFFSWFMVIFLMSSITESLLQRQIGIVFFSFFSTLFLIYQDKKPKFVKN